MADIPNRADKESILAAAILAELERFGKLMARTIPGLQSALEAITPEYWREHTAKLTTAISPNLQQTYTAQAAAILDDLPFIDIEWAVFNADATKWARKYTFDLISGLNLTSERTVNEAITSYFEQGWTKDQLTEVLTPTFGKARADMIGITETTRAAVEGESEVVRRLEEDSGIIMKPFWITTNDERVCPICGPRNGLEIRPDNATRGQYPPAHPRCRCLTRHEIVE